MSNNVVTATMQLSRPTVGMESYLTGDPKQSIFSSYEHQQHTPYARNTAIVPFSQKVGYGRTLSAEIPYVGDLLADVHLHFRLPPLAIPEGSTFVGYTNTIGYAMIESVELRIGEKSIVTRSDVFLEVMDYLETGANKKIAKGKAVGRYDTVNVLSHNAVGHQDLYVPLNLWLDKRPASALPLLKLGGLPVRVVVKLKPFSSCVTYDGPVPPVECAPTEAGLIAYYYVLSDDEKVAFQEEDQVYLIDQWQIEEREIPAGMSRNRFRLDFNLSVKELVWVLVEKTSEENNDFFNYGRRDAYFQGGEFINAFSFYLDGRELISRLPESHARLNWPARHHTFAGDRNIYVLPFAEYPEILHQSSGTCNFSSYDTIELGLDFVQNLPSTKLHIAAISYNRLIISENGFTLEFLT